ncbi:MAG: hypothetical protein PF508_14210 [Spirochaeta sp.]|jgi:hypothetical protein|nr:hypothetical protein [Spirochaeta sp.]
MKSRRSLILVIGLGALLAIGLLIMAVRGFREEAPMEPDRFADREILVPGIDYEIPSVEEEILAPRFEYYIDPEKPLDRDIVEELEPDIGAALRDTLTPAVEAELEELLFHE